MHVTAHPTPTPTLTPTLTLTWKAGLYTSHRSVDTEVGLPWIGLGLGLGSGLGFGSGSGSGSGLGLGLGRTFGSVYDSFVVVSKGFR